MPVYEHLKTIQLQQKVINADETPVKVINEDKMHCYMWVFCTGADSPIKDPPPEEKPTPNIVLYEYQDSCAGACPKACLQDFNGYLQVDGYAGYEQTAATLVGCFAHARRKFTEAKKAQVKGKSARRDNVFVEMLWRSAKYEEVCLNAYEPTIEAKKRIDAWIIIIIADGNIKLWERIPIGCMMNLVAKKSSLMCENSS